MHVRLLWCTSDMLLQIENTLQAVLNGNELCDTILLVVNQHEGHVCKCVNGLLPLPTSERFAVTVTMFTG